MNVTFKRTRSDLWMGNGMGTAGAQYDVLRDGVKAGEMWQQGNGDWVVTLTDGRRLRPYSGKQVDAKALAVEKLIAGAEAAR